MNDLPRHVRAKISKCESDPNFGHSNGIVISVIAREHALSSLWHPPRRVSDSGRSQLESEESMSLLSIGGEGTYGGWVENAAARAIT